MISYISALPPPAWTNTTPRRVSLLGSTGSIGVSALRVIASQPTLFQVAALAGGRNIRLLAQQAAQWRPAWLGVLTAELAHELAALLPDGYQPRIVHGPEGYAQLASLPCADTVLSAQVGAAGLYATMAAAVAGKVICLANKESLVMAGDVLRTVCCASGAVILPVDSEHNAVFQALQGREADVHRVIITASGGPFRGRDRAFLAGVTREQALNHPNWSMGAKITIDSATLMNKGLEVIEACQLYGVTLNNIGVLVHPQSLVHALVEFADGSLMAHMGAPDMRMAIAHCLAWPHCVNSGVSSLNLAQAGTLTFEEPDLHSFPCLALAYRALNEGANSCVILNAANEVAVEAFLGGRIGFMDIPSLIEKALDEYMAGDPHPAFGNTIESTPPACLLKTDLAQTAFTQLAVIEKLDRATRRRIGVLIETI